MSAPDAGATSSFTVSIPQSGVQSRAVTDDFGKGTSVNRCILEIYHGDQLYNRIVKPVSNKQVTFDNLRLVSSQTYDFVFWADCADNGVDKYYDTESGLTQISAKEYKGNEERFDAFFLCQKDYKVEASFNETGWVLKRPFGQLNIKTDDLGDIPTELQPDAVSVVFKNLPTSFNALEGVTKLLDSMKRVKSILNPSLDIFGIVLTMYDSRTNLANQVVNEVRSFFGDEVFETLIPRTVKLSEAPSYGQSILEYAPDNKGALAYNDLAKEVIARG